METEQNEVNSQWDMKTRLAFQVKLCEMMLGGDFEKWTDKYAKHFHDVLEEDPSLKDRVYAELDANWNAPTDKESPLVREIADVLQALYDQEKEAEPDEESFKRAA